MTLNISPMAGGIEAPDSLYKRNNKNETMTMLGQIDQSSATPKRENSQETENSED